MSFSNIQRKFVAFQPGFQLLKVTVNSLIQLSQIMRLMAQTGIISIHGNSARYYKVLYKVLYNCENLFRIMCGRHGILCCSDSDGIIIHCGTNILYFTFCSYSIHLRRVALEKFSRGLPIKTLIT